MSVLQDLRQATTAKGTLPVPKAFLPFRLLDVPGNITRSAVRFGQTLAAGDPEFDLLTNIGRELIPFVEAERIGAEEITGSENPLVNIATEILLDPLLFVSGIGGLSKGGKLLKRIQDLKVAKRARELSGLTEEAGKIGIELNKDIGKFRKLLQKPSKFTKERNIIAKKFRDENKIEAGFREKITGQIFRTGALHNFDKLPAKFQTITGIEKLESGFIDKTGKFYTRKGLEQKISLISPVRTKPKISKRTLVSLGLPFSKRTIDLGNATGLQESISRTIPVGFLPDIRKGSLLKKVEELNIKLIQANATGKTNKAARIQKEIVATTAIIEGFKPTAVPIKVAGVLRGLVASGRAKFDATASNKLVEALQEVGESQEARALAGLSSKEREFQEAFEIVRQAENLEKGVLLTKLTEAREANLVLRVATTPGTLRTAGVMVGSKTSFPNIEIKASIEALKTAKRSKKNRAIIHKIHAKDPIKLERKLAEESGRLEDRLKSIRVQAEISKRRLDEIVKFQGKLSPQELALNDRFFALIEDTVKVEQNVRINVHSLQQNLLGYMTRLLTPTALALKRSNNTKYNLITSSAKTKLNAAFERRVYPEKSIVEINKLLQKEFGFKGKFFDEDPIRAVIERRRDHIKAVYRAKTANVIIEQFAQTGIKGVAVTTGIKFTGKNKKHLGFLERVGLFGGAIGDLPAIEKGLKLPQDIFDDALKVDRLLQQSIFNDENILKFFDTIDKYVNAPFKLGVTTFFPAFHNRNMVGNWFLNMLGGVTDPNWYAKAALIQHRIRLTKFGRYTPTSDEIKLFDEIATYKIGGRGFIEDLYRNTGWSERLLNKFFIDIDRPITGTLDRIVARINKRAPVIREDIAALRNPFTGRAYGEFIEGNARIAHYMAKKADGLLPFEAMRSVNKYLFDYSKLTNFEKQVMRPTFLFYTWMRKNLPLQIRTLLVDPKVGSIYGKITNIGEDDAPNYLRASGAFPFPGRDDIFIGSFGLPIEDLHLMNVADVDPIFWDQIKRQGQKIISKMSPALKFPYEVATGESSFSRRKLRSTPTLKIISDLLPTSRTVRLMTSIVDEKKSLGFRALDAMTGLKTYPFRITAAKLDELKRFAVGTGEFKRSGFLVIPKPQFKEKQSVKELQKQMRILKKKLDREKKGV